MNIFVLDEHPYKAAKYHCDKHVVKMILESARMLCTVHRRYALWAPYKPVHQKHPCTLWVGESVQNYSWMILLVHALYAVRHLRSTIYFMLFAIYYVQYAIYYVVYIIYDILYVI